MPMSCGASPPISAGACAELEREIHKLAGHRIQHRLAQAAGRGAVRQPGPRRGGKKGKTGAYATGADVLEELAAQGHELPARVLDWRQLEQAQEHLCRCAGGHRSIPTTGRVHTSFAMAATSTGRLSSNDPNLQNIPIRTEEGRKIRGTFIAEQGHKLLSVDYSQIELRLAAHMADIAALKEAFRDGIDIHALTASQVFGVPVEGMDPMVRRKAKAINFGIIYGISALRPRRSSSASPRARPRPISRPISPSIPASATIWTAPRQIARAQGYVSDHLRPALPCARHQRQEPGAAQLHGARRHQRAAPGHRRRHHQARHDPHRSGAWPQPKLKARMLLQVHDELLFEVPEAEVEATAAVVQKVMEGAAWPGARAQRAAGGRCRASGTTGPRPTD